MAISQAKTLSIEASVIKSRGKGPPCNANSTARRADARQNSLRSSDKANKVPLPGKARPSTSQRQFMELAVNIPEQEPAPGQALHSTWCNSSSVILPALQAATASNTLLRSKSSPFLPLPTAMGPPEQKMVGMLHRKAPITIPGTILSQLGMQMQASKACALSMVSTLSAINSRLASENFMP